MILTIYVGEPWDFRGPDGRNKIKGEVVFEINEDTLIFKSTKKQKFLEGKGNLFLLLARHVGVHLINSDRENKNRYFGSFGAGLLKDNTEYKNKTKEELEKESKYVFIGSFKQDY